MLGSLARLLAIIFRERPAQFKPGVRYSVTLDLSQVRPRMQEADVKNWLMTMGFTPTASPAVWKAFEQHLSRIPKDCILKARKL